LVVSPIHPPLGDIKVPSPYGAEPRGAAGAT
jgi:hypothetical protein